MLLIQLLLYSDKISPFSMSFPQSKHREKSAIHVAPCAVPGVVAPQLLQRTQRVHNYNTYTHSSCNRHTAILSTLVRIQGYTLLITILLQHWFDYINYPREKDWAWYNSQHHPFLIFQPLLTTLSLYTSTIWLYWVILITHKSAIVAFHSSSNISETH